MTVQTMKSQLAEARELAERFKRERDSWIDQHAKAQQSANYWRTTVANAEARAIAAEKERDEARAERARAGARADKNLCDLQDANSRILRLEAALRNFVGSAPHWRTFLTIRERIHFFDEVVTEARNLLEAAGLSERTK